ncbi:MAG: hypothetical protein JW755_04465 [Candidatus Aminicenantes bacterium]|nr:hypothetical protein [Candidatus Aminicenantes bacterium]
MKKNLLFFFLMVTFLALNPFHKLYSQDNCRQILNNGIQAFINASFEEAINYFSQIKNNPALLQDCSMEDREKVEFYNSYCLYLLYGSQDQRTYQALCDLKLYCPSFSPEKEDYQWITQDWIDCWANSDCFTGPVISNIYGKAKYFFEQDFPIQAAAEILILYRLTENGQRLPPDCPDCLQYVGLANEYMQNCESSINEKWISIFENENYLECLNLENTLVKTEGLQNYFPNLIQNISTKKKETTETLAKDILDQSINLINQIRTSLFTVPDLSQLKLFWAKIKNLEEAFNENTRSLTDLETIQQIQSLSDQIVFNFQRYSENLIQHFDLRQEDAPQDAIENYKNTLMAIFPESQTEIETVYQNIIQSPPPVFNTNNPGVTPPEDDGKWKIPQLECLKKIYLHGDILCGITINNQGVVENVTVISKRFNIDNECSNKLVEELTNYIRSKKFIPARKTLNCSGFVSPTNRTDRTEINVKYFLVKRLKIE